MYWWTRNSKLYELVMNNKEWYDLLIPCSNGIKVIESLKWWFRRKQMKRNRVRMRRLHDWKWSTFEVNMEGGRVLFSWAVLMFHCETQEEYNRLHAHTRAEKQLSINLYYFCLHVAYGSLIYVLVWVNRDIWVQSLEYGLHIR